MSARTSKVGTAVVAAAGLVLVTGCGPTMRDLPLPGSGVSGDTITIKVQFDEALNLAQGAAVKVNGVDSGKVQKVTTKDFKAIATLKVRTSAQLRSDASARLRYTTPLGELFVDVSNPARGALAADGQTLDPKKASTAPTVEDALASASLLVNGGGLNQLQTVTDQLNKAIGGREGTVRELLDRSNTFLAEANATTGDIDRALNALAGVSRILKENESTINAAMKDIRPAARVLRENTPGFTKLLAKLVEFSDAANTVVGQTRAQTLQMVKQVTPVLDEFLSVSADLGPSFKDLVHVGKLLNQAIPGDYANMFLILRLDGSEMPDFLGPGGGGSTGSPGGLLGGILDGLNGVLGGKKPTKATPSTTGGVGGLLSSLLGGGAKKPAATAPAEKPTLFDLLGGDR
ncbi:MCE family protein [Nocardioides marmoriginsengisoli]|uniref:MCE family protein n=1 Tax=Nocardioides marmoriginsengisoli TaxID=661483 RepID=A0A3N0CMY4_9ACTN|nr:MCE family protein [Nocardioides marmoriginsengisoli]RNL64822.1 MCE family protein [Nocardioides marmoriginsengisoli]